MTTYGEFGMTMMRTTDGAYSQSRCRCCLNDYSAVIIDESSSQTAALLCPCNHRRSACTRRTDVLEERRQCAPAAPCDSFCVLATDTFHYRLHIIRVKLFLCIGFDYVFAPGRQRAEEKRDIYMYILLFFFE